MTKNQNSKKLYDLENRTLEFDGIKDLEKDQGSLIQESTELMNIFGAILKKS